MLITSITDVCLQIFFTQLLVALTQQVGSYRPVIFISL